MLKKIGCILLIIIILVLLGWFFNELIIGIKMMNLYQEMIENSQSNWAMQEMSNCKKDIFAYSVCILSLVSCAALIISYPLRFSFQGYREKYDAWVQRRKEAAFQRKYLKAKKNLEQEKKKLEKMEKEKAGK